MPKPTDPPDTLDALATARRYCPNCGHANRLMAKICVNCGQSLPAISLETRAASAPPESAETNTAFVTANSANLAKTARRAKRCPDCATVCKLDAKVCLTCGHRFQTDFSQARPTAPLPVVPPPVSKPGMAGEAPIVQMASTGITLVPDKAQPVQLPPDPTSARLPPSPAAKPVLSAAPKSDPTPMPPPVDDVDSTEGEPAPDVTDVDLTALRRRHSDQASGLFTRNSRFKKDNP